MANSWPIPANCDWRFFDWPIPERRDERQSGVDTMMPGPKVIYACPACGQLAGLCTLASGNTFGARWWTDGKIEAPMLPIEPEIAHCQGCDGYYWLDKARKVGEYDVWYRTPADAPDEWKRAPDIEDLSEQELMSALNSPAAADLRRERKLRILLWWTGNNRFREQNEDELPSQQEYRANMERLYAILKPRGSETRLMRAELARELGLFEACLALLTTPLPEQLQETADLIRRLADQHITKVAEIKA
jgi:hypothetical protein